MEDSFAAKIKFVASLINQVGIPVVFFMVVFSLGVGAWMGYIESPLVTNKTFDIHALNTTELHGKLIVIGSEQVKVLKGIEKEFKVMRCERLKTLLEQNECLSKLSREE